jgi:molybdopterin molybdotransferase
MSDTTPKTCCDDYDPNSLNMDAALQRIEQAIRPISAYECCNLRMALDRVLAQTITSPINVPAHTNSAMDGYAIRGADIPASGDTTLDVVATVMAGSPTQTVINSGQCARIMTGGKMPAGSDTVIMQEHVTRNDNRITIGSAHQAGQNVRHAGEDLATGDEVMTPGRRLSPADLGMLASLGISEVKIYRRLRVAFFSTGDELRSVGQVLEEGQIYDSNRYTLHGMLSRFGADILDMGVIPDQREAIRNAFQQAASQADVLITSGGVSVGEADFVKETLSELGDVNFWKIAMKPGRPLAFGNIQRSHFFGLPGNPVSAMVTFYQFVVPALRKLSGQPAEPPLILELPCVTPLRKSPGRVEFQRGIMETNELGNLVVRSTGEQGSGILSSMGQADCFIILPMDAGNVEANTLVKVQPFAGLV